MTITENQAKRAKLAEKIRALLSKTVENGCTESEALIAADMANKLMAEYDLTYQDINAEVRAERFGARKHGFHKSATNIDSVHEVVRQTAKAIAQYCNCKVYTSTISETGKKVVVFFGTVDDTRTAVALTSLIVLTADTEWQRFLKSPTRPNINGRSMRTSFMVGMGNRIAERLDQMTRERNGSEVRTATGTSLVVVKNQIVTEEYGKYLRANGIQMGGGRKRTYRRHESAYSAGQAAGGRADLGGGKVGSGGQARIGK